LFSFPASLLDEVILRFHNNTACPCSTQICKRTPGGYRIAVALVGSMRLHPDLRDRATSVIE